MFTSAQESVAVEWAIQWLCHAFHPVSKMLYLTAFKGEATSGRDTLISHSAGGSFAIRQGSWKLCLSGGSGGWSAPREGDAKKKGLPRMPG